MPEYDTTPPTKGPRQRRRGLWPVLTIIALFVGVGIGQAGTPDEGPDDAARPAGDEQDSAASADRQASLDERSAELDTWQAELDELAQTLEQRESDVAARENAVTETEEAVAATTIPGEGLYVVGEDLEAGEYKTSGPSGGNTAGCYYAFKSDTSATAEIVDNNILQGQGRVTLSDGDVFETTGCADWTLVD